MAIRQVRQVSRAGRWPSGDSRDLVELRLSPAELTSRFGLTFEDLHDDLDWLQLAAIELPDGSPAWLYHYRGDGDAGTFVRVDSAADLVQARAQLQQLLGLTHHDVLWASSDSAIHGTSAGQP